MPAPVTETRPCGRLPRRPRPLRVAAALLALALLDHVPVHAQQAPDFTLKDTQGRDVSLSDYHGRPVVLVFTRSFR